MKIQLLIVIAFTMLLTACTGPSGETADETAEEKKTAFELPDEQDAFWQNIRRHCGNAYDGRIADATPHYQGFTADRITIHFRNCPDTLMHISLHLDDNHSRNMLLTNMKGALRLKHDHRNQDGSEEVITQYGGDAPKPGLETRQIFPADNHTAHILPERADNFWFLDLMDENTLAYGVHWPKHGHSIRMEFDLSNPVDPPPAPWGY
ncbi:MAG: hypothetical protein LC662_06490 [Rhodothermaceae bacterium]|nr:hypothetical protein [Rhodothermaceae bacterium]